MLEQVFAKDRPELFVLFSSVSSIIGLPGQIDYTAANAFLDAYAIKANRAGDTRALVVNWNAWQEVGMAVDAAQAELDKAPAGRRPTRRRPAPCTCSTPSPTTNDVVVALDGLQPQAQLVARRARRARRRRADAGHRLPRDHPVRGRSRAMPAEAGRAPRRLLPLAVRRRRRRGPHAEGEATTGPPSSVLVFSDAEASPHVTATVDAGRRRARRPPHRPRRRSGPGARVGSSASTATPTSRSWTSGPAGEPALGRVRRRRGPRHHRGARRVRRPSWPSLWLHPAVLDVATGSAQALIPGFAPDEMFYVPFSLRPRARRAARCRPRAVSHVRLRTASAHDLAVFDITIVRRARRRGRRRHRGLHDAPRRRRAPRSPPAASSEPATRAGRGRVDRSTRRCARASCRPRASTRSTASSTPGSASQVVASSVDVDHWIAKVDAEATAAGDDVDDPAESGGPQYERPNISSAYAAPATPIERELATMWRELLGVERVGRDDDFFELGGQSLIAVRLFTRMKKRYSVDLPLATLFEAPTIAQCAAIVAAKLGIVDADADAVDGDADGDAVERRRTAAPVRRRPASARRTDADEFRSLVTIQRGGDLIPFFCVHGSGGNVLNFRDLSQAMGRSQPFYGLQARGIDGRARAARLDRGDGRRPTSRRSGAVQPHGPVHARRATPAAGSSRSRWPTS